ncbi:kinase-like domain-containing protein [Cokeromyces recurvatus]|uniref:kinase-like domain-containing protein n=1 Tax=Cokeromyces recurvatus TaxID=90255 RepID=UPI0022201242|nr:kinase-like domain-containing protein [Cokeromyces recurvatus]KAI7904054.1 kinase-like domain-containing protein [Cokeromyces recurvatus]
MDPGYKLLQHIKTVPNLINEDPSITTPKNSTFMDMPWSEFSKLLKTSTTRSNSYSSESSSSSSSSSSTGSSSPANEDISLETIDDPLLLYEQQIIINSKEEDFLHAFQLLEKAILKYKNDIRYKNSPRYLKLWLTYIFYLKPTFIFPVLFGLIENQIGDKLATLYEAIAYQLLKEKNYHQVEATLILGLKRKAQPIKRLDHALHQFKSTHSIDFNINQYKLDSFMLLENDIHYNNSQHAVSFKDQLNWIDVKLRHNARLDVLRECYRREKHEVSFEELRARSVPYKQINNMVNYQQLPVIKRVEEQHHVPSVQQKSTVVQLPLDPQFIHHLLQIHHCFERHEYHDLLHLSSKKEEKKLESWFLSSKQQQQQKNTKLIQLDENTYHVIKLLGQGGMAHIYLVQDIVTCTYYGLKVQRPPHPWEYYIHCQLHERHQEETLNLIPIHHFYHYKDASFLLMDHIRHGSLLDALNMYRPAQTYMPEPIVLLFTLQLLEQIKALHDLSIVHNDLKLDNVMLSMKRNHIKGLIMPKVILIDYGYSIDVASLNSTTTTPLCKANWPPACPESDFPYLNQPYYPIHADYWQLATIVHLLLFGSPMHAIKDKKNNQFVIQHMIKRYWHKQLWLDFFLLMLNPPINDTHKAIQDMIDMFKSSSHDITKDHKRTFITMLHDKYKF